MSKATTKKQTERGKPSLLLHIVLALGLSAAILGLIWWGLGQYTRNGVSVTVPSLEGQMVGQAIRQLKEVGLEYEIVDSTYNVDAVPRTVADVTPIAGSAVKPGRIIFLRIYAHSPKSVSIPWVEGQSARNAMARLRGLGFDQLSQRIVSSQDIGACLGLTKTDGTPIKAGDLLPKNTPIVVLVGEMVQDTLSLVDLIDGYGSDSLAPAAKTPPPAQSTPRVDEPTIDDPDDWFS